MVAVTPPPPWVEYAIWWQVYPLGFCGAPIREADGVPHPAHRLPRLTGWLDQVIELGAERVAARAGVRVADAWL